MLDGASSVDDLVEAACRAGMPAIALTDHDGLYAAPAFYKASKAAGIKSVIGAEFTLEEGFHVTLLARDQEGYANLCRLVTAAQLAGTKGEPRLAFSRLADMSGGLICLSGCRRGEIPALLLGGKKAEALDAARRYLDVFGQERFFIELQHHLHPEDRTLCTRLLAIARATGVRPVATNNVHYAAREDHRLQDVLVCIKNRVTLDTSASFRKANSEYYLKGEAEMLRLPLPADAIHRAAEIAEACSFELDFSSYRFPDFPLPGGERAGAYLRRVCLEKARSRFVEIPERVRSRLDAEFELIEGKGLTGYFLIVWDIMEFARRQGILAQGRGSAASSLVAYILGITPVDPIEHNLFVGRFLNEFAVPDIDIDIDSQRREEVIRYVYEKYGEEHAAMVCTYVTFRAKNAIREVGKVLGLPAHLLDRMAKSIPSYGAARAIDDLRGVGEFAPYLGSEAWEQFRSLCTKIADFPRHLSIHVGGMIISSRPISEMVPLERARAEGRVVCQWDKDGVDDAGLIKVDLLGLRMLSLIDEVVRVVEERRGVRLDLEEMPMDDPGVYEMIGSADTVGVFQVESRAQMQTLPRVRPKTLSDLGVEVAIVRPGPLQGNMVHPYMRRRQGKEPVEHLHPSLEPILGETLGVILYQEQVLQVAMAIAGFSAGEGNLLRKAMGRKNAAVEMQKWRARFIDGAAAKAIGAALANRVFDLISGFAEFGFCKSHAMSFALLCYRSAFLKKYYPLEFYCALLNNQPMGFYVPEVVVGDARRHGVAALPVDVNRSHWACTIEEGHLRLGFRYVKEMGEDRAERITAARADGPFGSLEDCCVRTGLDKESLKNLVLVGAFDGLERTRRQLLWRLGSGMAREGGIEFGRPEKVSLDEMNHTEELFTDYEIQGFSAKRQLLAEFRPRLARAGAVTSAVVAKAPSGTKLTLAGLNVCLQMPPTAKGFAFMTLEDEEGLVNVVVRPEVYRVYRQVARLEPLVVVTGVVERTDGVVNVIARHLDALR